MAEPEPLWSDPGAGLAIRLTRHSTPEVLDLLERTVWGSGGTRYRIMGVAAKLGRLTGPLYLSLEKRGRLAAVCVLNRRRTRLLERSADSAHFVMLATEPAFGGQGLASLLAEQAGQFLRRELDAPGAAYAYIEATTDYSVRISNRIGPAVEASLPLTVFSRLRPRADRRAGPLDADDVAQVVQRLSALYQGHLFADFEESLVPGDYHVLRDGAAIVAGVQAEPLTWSVQSLPGVTGGLIIGLLPRLPLLNRVLDPSALHFLRFGNLLAEPGREGALVRLMEAVLARHRVPLGLILLDARSPVYRRLRACGGMGLLARAVDGTTKAVADFKGLSDAEILRMAECPMLMSPLDVF